MAAMKMNPVPTTSLADAVGNLMSPDVETKPMEECVQEQKVVKKVSKMMWVSPSHDEFDDLVQLIRELMDDGHGETIFEIGVGNQTESEGAGLNKEDLEAAVATLQSVCDTTNASCALLRQKDHGNDLSSAEYLIRLRSDSQDFLEVRVAVVGNVDAGKSTLLGVLTHGELDNGRGTARMKLFKHKHEMETGRTSSIGNDILGFDSTGNVVNKPDHGHLDWVKICEQSAKVVTFIDLAGHEKYLKTTVSGMTGHVPDFCMLMVGANAGVIGMTKEHLGLALALAVPVFVVVTKVDMCPVNVLQDTLKLLQRVLKSPGCRKIPVLVSNRDDAVMTATNFTSQRICPIFQVSNVTGENLDLLRMFLNLLNTRIDASVNEPAEFQIDDTFSVPGVGTVVSGTCLKGHIQLNDTLLLGPDALGNFMPVPIKSIHRKRLPVREVRGGQTASFAIKKIKRSTLRKGMVLVSPSLQPQACWEFHGEILVLHHPTTISVRYQAMVHIGSIRQTASILNMSQEHLRTGDKALCRFRFIKNPEYLRPNMKMVFREGRTKAVGTVVTLCPHISGVAQTNSRAQRAAKKAADVHGQGTSRGGAYHEPQKSSKRGRRTAPKTAIPTTSTTVKEDGAAQEQKSPRSNE